MVAIWYTAANFIMYFEQVIMGKPAIPLFRNRDRVWELLLLAATLFVYQPAWNGEPVWDDELHITPPELRSIEGLVHIWTHPRKTVQYFPLAHTVFWVEAMLWGDWTLGYHLLNILLHFFSSLLLVKILRKLGIGGAWFAAGIFALHPVMVESVAWITELKNTLSGLFFLSAALAYVTYTENGKKCRYISSLALFILGLLSKTGIAPFPAAMLAAVWWKRGGLQWRRDVVPLLPFILAGFLFGLITVYVEMTFIGTRGAQYESTLVERTIIAGRALWFYLGKILLPVNLMISYPRWTVSAAVWRQYLFPAAALVALCILWAVRRIWRAPLAVFLYFTAMLMPYLGFFSLFAFRYSFVADHYQYLAAIGPMALAAALADKAAGSIKGSGPAVKLPLAVLLLIVLGMSSRKQSRMYSDAQTLYRTTIARNGNSWMAHNNLGLLLANMGRTGEAVAYYRKALEINPSYAEAHNNLGLLLANTGQYGEAEAHFLKAIEINPGYGGAHFNLGLLLANMGRTGEAAAYYRKALEINPNHAKTLNNLGLLLANTGKTGEAMAHYLKALSISPSSAETHYNLGLLFSNTGQTDKAMVYLLKAIKLNPKLAEAHNNLGILLAQRGRFDEAKDHFRKALELKPDYENAKYNLGLLLAKTGQNN